MMLAEGMPVDRRADFSSRSQRLAMSGLIALTVSAVFATLLYVGAFFGSSDATDLLVLLSLPNYNVFAHLIPDNLENSSIGTELLLGAVIFQTTWILTLVIFILWTTTRSK